MGSPAIAPQYFSQVAQLQQSAAAIAPAVAIQPGGATSRSAIAAVYNRLGKLFRQLASMMNVPLPAALAVFYVESSGQPLTPGQAIIRFEVHHLWGNWGSANEAAFDSHFQFGGHAGVPGKPWEGRAFRANPGATFAAVHSGHQSTEYAAFALAQQLAGLEVAARCISIGGCQIMGSNFAMLGYRDATSMFHAFQANENAHVLGFFDFCAHQEAPHVGGLIGYLQQGDFGSFARFYNGSGQVDTYAGMLQKAAADAAAVLSGS